MTPRHFTVQQLEGSTITLSIKYIGHLFCVKFVEMLINCVLSIFSNTLLLITSCVIISAINER